jgi:hypothetical protein
VLTDRDWSRHRTEARQRRRGGGPGRSARDRLDDLAARIRSDGGAALVLQTDVTEQRQALDAVEQTVAEPGSDAMRPIVDDLTPPVDLDRR